MASSQQISFGGSWQASSGRITPPSSSHSKSSSVPSDPSRSQQISFGGSWQKDIGATAHSGHSSSVVRNGAPAASRQQTSFRHSSAGPTGCGHWLAGAMKYMPLVGSMQQTSGGGSKQYSSGRITPPSSSHSKSSRVASEPSSSQQISFGGSWQKDIGATAHSGHSSSVVRNGAPAASRQQTSFRHSSAGPTGCGHWLAGAMKYMPLVGSMQQTSGGGSKQYSSGRITPPSSSHSKSSSVPSEPSSSQQISFGGSWQTSSGTTAEAGHSKSIVRYGAPAASRQHTSVRHASIGRAFPRGHSAAVVSSSPPFGSSQQTSFSQAAMGLTMAAGQSASGRILIPAAVRQQTSTGSTSQHSKVAPGARPR